MLRPIRALRVCGHTLVPVVGALLLAGCSSSDTGVDYSDFRDADFEVQSIEPAFGPPGTKVRLNGYGFGRKAENIRIAIGGVPVDSMSVSPTKVEFRVPRQAATGGMMIQRFETLSSMGMSYPFKLILSPYHHNSFQLELSGITAIGKSDYSNDAGDGWSRTDTTEVKVGLGARATGLQNQGSCMEFTNGDTIRICYHPYQSERFDYNGYWKEDNRITLQAVVDSVRRVLTTVEVGSSKVSMSQEGDLESSSDQQGLALLLRDLPYQTEADGSISVLLEGPALAPMISRYAYTYGHSSRSNDSWFVTSEVASTLFQFRDDAVLKLRLYYR